MAIIEVTDNGAGLDAQAAERIFEPYFTTKTTGTGLGMAITHRIITEHGGLVAAENRAEGGTRVTIRLPTAGAATPGAGSPKPLHEGEATS